MKGRNEGRQFGKVYSHLIISGILRMYLLTRSLFSSVVNGEYMFLPQITFCRNLNKYDPAPSIFIH